MRTLNEQNTGIFHCDACRVTFMAEKEPEQCPDCGKYSVRPATGQEKEEYFQYKKEFANGKY